ncbi:uncharacterized protein BcabD6B2_26830 [Babesia caballi]|uniref:Uncharacterized protein n=1 Tax=Babesia caballi TaxID=5871 RepID=A0AAV4LTJ4_BABCB|nr:hypothetical protein BcabD6B2_26830 [Babesia caballi]
MQLAVLGAHGDHDEDTVVHVRGRHRRVLFIPADAGALAEHQTVDYVELLLLVGALVDFDLRRREHDPPLPEVPLVFELDQPSVIQKIERPQVVGHQPPNGILRLRNLLTQRVDLRELKKLVVVQQRLLLLHLLAHPHELVLVFARVGVPLKLEEGPLNQKLRRGVLDADQVEQHVVAQVKRAVQPVRLPHEDGLRLLGFDAPVQHDYHQTVLIQTAPARPPRHLDVLARRDEAIRLTVPLAEGGEDHAPGRHVNPHREGLSAEEHLYQPLLEQNLDDFLDDGQQAAVVDAYPALEQRQHEDRLRQLPVVVGQRRHGVLVYFSDEVLLRLVRHVQRAQRGRVRFAFGLGEGEDDHRRELFVVAHGDHRLNLPRVAPPLAAPLLDGVQRPHRLEERVLPEAPRVVQHQEHPVGLRRVYVVLQRRRPVVGCDDVARHVLDPADPLGELDRVGYRRREEDQVHLLRDQDDGLLPDDAPLGVAHVVHLVEDHPLHLLHDFAPPVEHRPEDLRRHHHDGGVRVERHVPRHEPDVHELVAQVAVLLVAQRLDRARVYDPPLVPQPHGDCVLRHRRLARRGVGADQHALLSLQAVDGLFLELVEREGVLARRLPRRARLRLVPRRLQPVVGAVLAPWHPLQHDLRRQPVLQRPHEPRRRREAFLFVRRDLGCGHGFERIEHTQRVVHCAFPCDKPRPSGWNPAAPPTLIPAPVPPAALPASPPCLLATLKATPSTRKSQLSGTLNTVVERGQGLDGQLARGGPEGRQRRERQREGLQHPRRRRQLQRGHALHQRQQRGRLALPHVAGLGRQQQRVQRVKVPRHEGEAELALVGRACVVQHPRLRPLCVYLVLVRAHPREQHKLLEQAFDREFRRRGGHPHWHRSHYSRRSRVAAGLRGRTEERPVRRQDGRRTIEPPLHPRVEQVHHREGVRQVKVLLAENPQSISSQRLVGVPNRHLEEHQKRTPRVRHQPRQRVVQPVEPQQRVVGPQLQLLQAPCRFRIEPQAQSQVHHLPQGRAAADLVARTAHQAAHVLVDYQRVEGVLLRDDRHSHRRCVRFPAEQPRQQIEGHRRRQVVVYLRRLGVAEVVQRAHPEVDLRGGDPVVNELEVQRRKQRLDQKPQIAVPHNLLHVRHVLGELLRLEEVAHSDHATQHPEHHRAEVLQLAPESRVLPAHRAQYAQHVVRVAGPQQLEGFLDFLDQLYVGGVRPHQDLKHCNGAQERRGVPALCKLPQVHAHQRHMQVLLHARPLDLHLHQPVEVPYFRVLPVQQVQAEGHLHGRVPVLLVVHERLQPPLLPRAQLRPLRAEQRAREQQVELRLPDDERLGRLPRPSHLVDVQPHVPAHAERQLAAPLRPAPQSHAAEGLHALGAEVHLQRVVVAAAQDRLRDAFRRVLQHVDQRDGRLAGALVHRPDERVLQLAQQLRVARHDARAQPHQLQPAHSQVHVRRRQHLPQYVVHDVEGEVPRQLAHGVHRVHAVAALPPALQLLPALRVPLRLTDGDLPRHQPKQHSQHVRVPQHLVEAEGAHCARLGVQQHFVQQPHQEVHVREGVLPVALRHCLRYVRRVEEGRQHLPVPRLGLRRQLLQVHLVQHVADLVDVLRQLLEREVASVHRVVQLDGHLVLRARVLVSRVVGEVLLPARGPRRPECCDRGEPRLEPFHARRGPTLRHLSGPSATKPERQCTASILVI